MKTVVSVSLGSSSRDHRAEVELLGERFDISRVGTDGSIDKAIAKLHELDGTVDAIGLGGIDVYLYAGKRPLRAARRAAAARRGEDDAGRRRQRAQEHARAQRDRATCRRRSGSSCAGKRVLMVSALDRFGMAQALVQAGADVVFGDFIFALDLDRPVRGLDEFEEMARKYLPDACKLPFQFFYPTGKKQDRAPQPKYPEYYEDAEIIAGDYHFMRQFMPDRLDGKTILTNTVTARDVDFLRERGIARLVTTTPDFGGRSFGTNVVEAAMIALLGKKLGRRHRRRLPRAARAARPRAPRDRVPGRLAPLSLLRKLFARQAHDRERLPADGVPLRRVLGVRALIAVGLGHDARRHLLDGRLRRERRRAGGDRRVRAVGRHLRVRRALLRRARVDGAGRRQRVHVRVRGARRVRRLGDRLGPHPRVRVLGRAARGDALGVAAAAARRTSAWRCRRGRRRRTSRSRTAGSTSRTRRSTSIAALAIVALAVLLAIGIRESAGTNVGLVVIQLVALVAFVLGLAGAIQPGGVPPVRAAGRCTGSSRAPRWSSSRTSASTR